MKLVQTIKKVKDPSRLGKLPTLAEATECFRLGRIPSGLKLAPDAMILLDDGSYLMTEEAYKQIEKVDNE